MSRNEQRRPGRGGVACDLIRGNVMQDNLLDGRCHALRAVALDPAVLWPIRRYRVRPLLAPTVAALAGLSQEARR